MVQKKKKNLTEKKNRGGESIKKYYGADFIKIKFNFITIKFLGRRGGLKKVETFFSEMLHQKKFQLFSNFTNFGEGVFGEAGGS